MHTRSAPVPRGLFARGVRLHRRPEPGLVRREPAACRQLACWMRAELERTGLGPRDIGRVLDLGCGTGDLLAELLDLAGVCELWGCDHSATLVRQAEELLGPTVRFFVQAPAPHLPFEDRSFGGIFAFRLLARPNVLADSWLLELRRVLRPGGRLLLGILDDESRGTAVRSGPAFRDREQWIRHLSVWFRVLSVTGEGDGPATVLVLERL